ncbi:MAG: dephospho-CoA kinase [Proteobacteria bacterium]|nr:dephospho-CoA kinase [Pseudomonadota bacterium]
MKVICLTGGLASGKSTAATFLAEKGANIVDADRLGHRVYDPGTQAFRKVIETFGEKVVAEDSHIDRKLLGSIVFGQPDQLKKLTDIVWPEIRRLVELEIAGLEAIYPDGIVVLEAAVLFEAGWEDIGDEIWVIVVDRETAIERSIDRDGSDREAVESRLDAQIENDERISKSDVVIENNGDLQQLTDRLQQEWERISPST